MIRKNIVAAFLTGCLLLAGGAAAETAQDAEAWTAVPLPDGTVMYVRYGLPGGVRMESINGSPDSLEVGEGRETGTPMVVTSQDGDCTGTADENLERVRRVLREELAKLPAGATIPPGRLDVAYGDHLTGEGRRVIVDRAPPPPPPRVIVETQPVAPVPPVPEAPPVDGAPGPATPPAQGIPAEKIVETRIIREQFLEGGLFRTNLILFETNRADLLPFSRDLLKTIGGVLDEFPGVRIRVEGHTDHRGSGEHNLDLSRRRAESVRTFLSGTTSLSASQIEALGYGEDRPIASGDSPTELALNRRVEFRILNPEALKRTTGE